MVLKVKFLLVLIGVAVRFGSEISNMYCPPYSYSILNNFHF